LQIANVSKPKLRQTLQKFSQSTRQNYIESLQKIIVSNKKFWELNYFLPE